MNLYPLIRIFFDIRKAPMTSGDPKIEIQSVSINIRLVWIVAQKSCTTQPWTTEGPSGRDKRANANSQN